MTKNSAVETIRARRSIRKFRSDKIAPEDLQKIVEVGQSAPSACNSQIYSLIEVRDSQLRKTLRSICGNSAFITEAAVVFVICADLRRLGKIIEYSGGTRTTGPVKGLFWGLIDAAIMAQNMVIAAELLGYGSVYIGWVSENMDQVIELLKIPRYVVPIVGLAIGYPRERPSETRPRLPIELIWQVDRYQDPPKDALKRGMDFMDRELQKQDFFATVAGTPEVESWCHDMIIQFGLKDQLKLEQTIKKTLRDQGFFPETP